MSSSSPEGMNLIGQIVQANVDGLARTTDQLLAGKDDEIRRLAEALIVVQRILDRATVIDRKTEALLRGQSGLFDHAARVLDRLDSET